LAFHELHVFLEVMILTVSIMGFGLRVFGPGRASPLIIVGGVRVTPGSAMRVVKTQAQVDSGRD